MSTNSGTIDEQVMLGLDDSSPLASARARPGPAAIQLPSFNNRDAGRWTQRGRG
jgi:hypothetical protein